MHDLCQFFSTETQKRPKHAKRMQVAKTKLVRISLEIALLK